MFLCVFLSVNKFFWLLSVKSDAVSIFSPFARISPFGEDKFTIFESF